MTQYVQERIVKMETPYMAWPLVGIAFALVIMYATFVNAAITNIVATKDMQEQVSNITSSIANLEASYLAAQSGLTSESAIALGLTESKSGTLYIAKRSLGSLSFNR